MTGGTEAWEGEDRVGEPSGKSIAQHNQAFDNMLFRSVQSFSIKAVPKKKWFGGFYDQKVCLKELQQKEL
jgi:hypothetical protein